MTKPILLLVLLCTSCAKETSGYDVKVYTDHESAGWAYKNNDTAFVVNSGNCTIKWNAVESKQGRYTLAIRKNCTLPFSGQIDIHRAILKKINQQWKLNRFESIYWGSFCPDNDWSWCIPIAVASANSEDYIDYQRNYPKSKLKNLNGLFVTLANRTESYRPFADLMNEFGVTIKLQHVEKVFAGKLNQVPFHKDLIKAGLQGNPRVMYDVGLAYFQILNQ